MDDPVKKPPAPNDVDWADIVFDLVHVVHELTLADVKRLQELREEMIRRGMIVAPLADPDKDQ